jgi:hypothetical protein
MAATAIGLRGQKGGAVCVAVALDAGAPRAVLSTFLATGAPDDRRAFEPYALARERVMAGESLDDAMAGVAEGRKRQDEAAANGLRQVMTRLPAMPVATALLVNRAGWISDLLRYSLEWAEHVPVAEGLAVREAFRAGCRTLGLALSELDETSLPGQAPPALGLPPDGIDARLKIMGEQAGRPWRREQKLAALAAWMAAAASRP